MTHPVGRLDGRLFVKDGRLCMVIESNPNTGQARVSMRMHGERMVVDMAMTEVCAHISGHLALDNLNSVETGQRVFKLEDGWYFKAREGSIGPHATEAEASEKLREYIVEAQAIDSDNYEPRRAAN